MTDKTYAAGSEFPLRLRDLGDSGALAEVISPGASLAAFAATIANGASVSNALDLGSLRAGSLVMPAAWTANVLTALVSHNGTDYSSLYDDTDTEWTITSANIVTGRARALPLSLFFPYRYLKLRSGTMAAPVNQGGDRVFYVMGG